MPKARASLSMTLDSPPGITRPRPGELRRPDGRRRGHAERREHTPGAPGSLPGGRGRRCGLRSPTHQPRSARRCGAGKVGDVDADHGLAEPARDLRDDLGVVVERRGLHDGRARSAGLPDLKCPSRRTRRPRRAASSCAASAGVAMPPATKRTTGSFPVSATSAPARTAPAVPLPRRRARPSSSSAGRLISP